MIEYRTGDLLAQRDLDYLVHGCNCQCTMGSGVAASIRKRWPQVYEADIDYMSDEHNMSLKLGRYSQALVKLDNDKDALVVNLYQQLYYGGQTRHLNYEAFYAGFENLKHHLTSEAPHSLMTIGMPFKMGCDRAGGQWPICEAMLNHLFLNEPNIKLVICKLP